MLGLIISLAGSFGVGFMIALMTGEDFSECFKTGAGLMGVLASIYVLIYGLAVANGGGL